MADFIGETNLLAIDYDGQSTLTVAGQWKLDIAEAGGAEDVVESHAEDAALAVRPERVRLDPEGELRGTVVASGYVGADVTNDACERLVVAEDFSGNTVFDATYLQIMWSSVFLAALTMLIALAVGFPTAV